MLKNALQSTVWETSLPLPLLNRGKVRDIYEVGKDKLLIVTTDRLSAFDVVLPSPIPDKGKVLNQISLFWFKKFAALVPNHILASDVDKMGFDFGTNPFTLIIPSSGPSKFFMGNLANRGAGISSPLNASGVPISEIGRAHV